MSCLDGELYGRPPILEIRKLELKLIFIFYYCIISLILIFGNLLNLEFGLSQFHYICIMYYVCYVYNLYHISLKTEI